MRVFPEPPADPAEECYVVACLPRRLVPILVGKVAELESRGAWATEDDWEQGYTWIVDFEAQLMNCKLLEHLQEMNVLLAHATGLVDDATPEQIESFMPALGARLKAIRDEDLDSADLLESAVARYPAAGTIPTGWFGLAERKIELVDVLQALRVGNSQTKDGLWDRFYEILLASSSGANIADLLADLFTDTVDAGLEGGVLIMTIASMMANITSQTDLALKLQRIIDSLDGGAFVGPSDNVLQALRGDVEADSTRNLASLSDELLQRLRETDPMGDSVLKNVEDLLK